MAAAFVILAGLLCLFLAAIGVTARQVSLALLGAFLLALGFLWPVLTHGFGG